MNGNTIKFLLLCLIIGGVSFGQQDTEGIVEENENSQIPLEKKKPEEVTGPNEVDAKDYAGKSVEIQSEDLSKQVDTDKENNTDGAEKITEQKSNTKEKQDVPDTPDQKVNSVQVTSPKSEFSNVNQLREDARLLLEQAEKLYDKAREFENESDDIDDEIEDLEDLADDLEDEAEELLEQASALQACIKISTETDELLLRDSSETRSDTSSTGEPMMDQKLLMLKMRNSADELLIKAKEIAIQVREMRETSGEKEGISGKFEDMAEDLEDKS